LLYTNDNLIGHSIYHYLIDSHENATRFGYDEVIHGKHLPLAQTVIFNLINKDISAIRIVDLLNALRLSLQRCQQPVLMVKSDIAGLCRELITVDNAMIISENLRYLFFFYRPGRQRTAAATIAQTAVAAGVPDPRTADCQQ
jgi:hypothetical protein